MTQSLQNKAGQLKIGIALGSGSARGWAHIGVIQALKSLGIEPQIVAGSSIGALIGAAYASDQLDRLEHWVRSLTWGKIVSFMDLSLLRGGGFIQGEKLLEYIQRHVPDVAIESLPRTLGMVATDLENGRETWFQQGPLFDGVRASISLPGLFTPLYLDGRWLVDGGLTNPVPVSLCRAMGADIVIAVNLNGDIVGKYGRQRKHQSAAREKTFQSPFLEKFSAQLSAGLDETTGGKWSQILNPAEAGPGMMEVLASSINIMQDRITRSRMAGDPPEIILAPRLAHLGLMEFDQAEAAINEGRAAVRRMQPALEQVFDSIPGQSSS